MKIELYEVFRDSCDATGRAEDVEAATVRQAMEAKYRKLKLAGENAKLSLNRKHIHIGRDKFWTYIILDKG